jgi:uncharacterized membrane protein YecN with MAPEG domain
MSLFEIFGFYLILNLMLLLGLIIGVVRIRFSKGVSLGDGGRADLMRASRAHGNFVENTPFALIGMISLMQLGTSPMMLHVVGATFTVGRIFHAIGMYQDNPAPKPRQIGTVLTLLTYLILIIYLIVLLIRSFGSYGVS